MSTETATAKLRDRAAQLRSEAAEAEAEARSADDADRARVAAAREKRDRAFVKAWNPAPLDAAVDAAHAALTEHLEADPTTKALVDYQFAQSRRRWLRIELADAQGRLGLVDAGSASSPPPPTPVALGDYVSTIVETLAANQLRAETEEFNNNNREDHHP